MKRIKIPQAEPKRAGPRRRTRRPIGTLAVIEECTGALRELARRYGATAKLAARLPGESLPRDIPIDLAEQSELGVYMMVAAEQPALGQRLKADAAYLAGLLHRRNTALVIYRSLWTIMRAVADGQLMVGAAHRLIRNLLRASTQQMLAGDALSDADRARLRRAWAEVELLEEQIRREQVGRMKETLKDKEALAKAVAAIAEEEHLFDVMLAQGEGAPLDWAALKRAAATWERLGDGLLDPGPGPGKDAGERRAPGR